MSNDPSQLETPVHPDDVPSLQRDVQRLLGRCLLRLQQYERLLKAIVAHHELAGPAHSLEGIRDARIQAAATKTLGTLIGKLLDSYVVTDALDSKAHFMYVNWFPQWAGELFWKLWVLCMAQRAQLECDHPFAFVTKTGKPYAIDSFERQASIGGLLSVLGCKPPRPWALRRTGIAMPTARR